MASVEERLAALTEMSSPDLQALWTQLTKTPVPRLSPKLMRLALDWEIQASVHGGFPPAL